MNILASGHTDIGRKRKTNQDSIYIEPEKDFFVVADGMGGHNGGDIASQMSVQIFPEFIAKHQGKVEIPKLLNETIKFINKSIYIHGQENDDLRGMGTTITSIMFCKEFAHIANIGDSRTYMVQEGNLFQMTKDHSLVQEKLNLGIYDRIGAKADPKKNILVKTVGFEESVEADVYKHRLNKKTLFLLCSDGLHGKVADQDILKIINLNIKDLEHATQEHLDNAVKQLIHQANSNGGQDNISVILAIPN